MIKLIDNSFDVKLYNEKAAHPMQSWEWGEARKATGLEILRIGEFSLDGKLESVFQLSFHTVPFLNKKIGYLPRSIFPSKNIIDFLIDYGKKNNFIFFKIEPYLKVNDLKEFDKRLIHSKNPLFPKWSMFLNLDKDEDALLKDLKPKTRYNIRLAKKKGVVVKEVTNEKGFNDFIKLYFDTCKRQKYLGHNKDYHKKIFLNLKDNQSHLLIAYYNEKPLAAYELFLFNNVLYYPYGGSSLEHRNLMAANLLMWETIKFGVKNKVKYFDMWGSLPPKYKNSDPWAGFTKFKEGYNAQFIEFIGSFDLVINKFYYHIFNLIFFLRNKILGI